MTVAGHWVLPSEVCAVYSVGRPPDRLCRSSNGCALRLAWAVFPRRNRLLLVLRSSSQLLLRRLCSLGFARKVHSHADCALAPSRCSHPCVERPLEGINQYREQNLWKKAWQRKRYVAPLRCRGLIALSGGGLAPCVLPKMLTIADIYRGVFSTVKRRICILWARKKRLLSFTSTSLMHC